jgi:D-alanyl-D-alanine carboxypeptidase/D-alanyl-D-alanine-endopeptidase (penicillin-binding protein 4)
MKGTPAEGHIRAKTGALERVRAISGFETTLGGERLVFAMFGNNNPQSGHDASATLDAIAVAMVEEIGAPPRAKTRSKAAKHP